MAAHEWTPPPVGAPCWIEIPTSGSVKELKQFYEAVFPTWQWREEAKEKTNADGPEVAHVMFDSSNGGGIVKYPADQKIEAQAMGCGMTVYFLVDDLEKIQAKVHELGGSTCAEKGTDGGHGTHFNFLDLSGNRFGVYAVNK